MKLFHSMKFSIFLLWIIGQRKNSDKNISSNVDLSEVDFYRMSFYRVMRNKIVLNHFFVRDRTTFDQNQLQLKQFSSQIYSFAK